MRGEEAVPGLHGAAQPHRLVVDLRHRRGGLLALRLTDRHGGHQDAQLGAVDGDAVGVQAGREFVRPGVRQIRRRPGQRGPRGGLDRHGAGDGGGVEARVCQGEAQGVDMAHEARVDDRDALPGREGGELRRDGAGAVRRDDDETECAQIALDRRRLDRLTGEDGGRQTDSLPGFTMTSRHVHGRAA